MASINLIKASDGTGNAAMATVQSTRAALATTIIVDTVDNIPATFYGSMGTPHTFVDPITAETITVISEATSRDFEGHVDGTNLEIDAMAPGNTDLGSTAGDVIIIKPTTEWANNIATTFAVAHNDDGSLKAVVSNQGWTDVTGTTVTATTANGNRSYDLTVDQDLRTVLSPGMRLRTTRTVASPTQCTSLNGTTQYYSKSSPAGMTFTDDFVAGAWVKLSSYAAGTIISRYSAGNGWALDVNASGQVRLYGYSGGAGNARGVTSYQSIPLNKWVHVSAQLDMSSNVAGTALNFVMLDGTDVPAFTSTTGTNPALLVQGGNLEVGSAAAGSFFPGKIAQAFVSSAKITQANIKTLYSQGLTPALITANSIISAYSFDGIKTDLNTTSANNLTANGSAVETNADSFAGGQADGTISSTLDHAIVQKVTASTITVQVAEGCTIPTSGGVSALSYATVKSPYGFPAMTRKWQIETHCKFLGVQNSPVSTTWYNLTSISGVTGGTLLNIPLGEWEAGYFVTLQGVKASTESSVKVTLSTSASAETDNTLTCQIYTSVNSAVQHVDIKTVHKSRQVSTTSATPYYLNTAAFVGTMTAIDNRGDNETTVIYATNAYL